MITTNIETVVKVWRVALATPLWQLFDYIPCVNPHQPVKGARVLVPFGARTLVGIFIEPLAKSDFPQDKLKTVKAVLDQEALFSPTLMRLCEWASQYYHYPLGEVLLNALPKILRQGRPMQIKPRVVYQVSLLGEQALQIGVSRAPKQAEALTLLQQQAPMEDPQKQLGISHSTLKALLAKNWVEKKPAASALKPSNTWVDSVPLTLNADQSQALDAIIRTMSFKPFLLFGVTGSGKTEVYLQAIQAVLDKGLQALVLVPEISLTPQTVDRFKARFCCCIAVLHSGLSDRMRCDMWIQAKQGDAKIVIGTRSAIFAPLSRLGIIIVDEEHDTSFKSQSQLRYSARDMAVMRARLENIPVVLGSATPSLESFYNVQRQRYQMLSLPERAGRAVQPVVRVVDLRAKKLQAGLSATLITAARDRLARGQQVLFFLNRRGFAPVLLCHQCGYVVSCKHCDAKLIVHHSPERLICHHCDWVIKPLKVCPDCKLSDLSPLGQGTEQLEQVLGRIFPDYNVLRIDRDTVTNRDSLSEKLTMIHERRADILIGTQMLAKGHHFPNLGLSAIVDADSGFFSIDFRAIERMAQLLIQVSGRAGRGEALGEVLIQTFHPQHPSLQLLLQEGYQAFMQSVLLERESSNLPPYCFQVLIRAEATDKQQPIDFLQAIKMKMADSSVDAFGPVPSLLERKQGRFRQQLLLQSRSRKALTELLAPICKDLGRSRLARNVRWSIDVDPQDVT